VLSVGGGGLLSGVIEGLKRNRLQHIPVLAIETEGAASLARSVEAGHRIELEAITSVATTLGAKKVCENAFAVTRSHDVRCAVVSDLDALEACETFLGDHRVLVEPACGASLATVYAEERNLLGEFKAPLVIVCGGATATLEQIQKWHREAADA
jgi:L-serine/L-threonine ammonia-lyase